LLEFAQQLNHGMRDCGIKVDKRPFAPHLTLMRKVNKAPQDMEFKAFHWLVSQFVLVESNTLPEGVQYTVLKNW
jgi:2'-5' RNA ligase